MGFKIIVGILSVLNVYMGRFGGISFEHEGSSQVYGTLFIGAPKESHEVHGSTWNSGVVRGCQFSQNAQVECTKISGILGKKPVPDQTCKRQKNFQYPENETEQWIGASLAATSEHLYACAPRWKLNGYYSRGGCSGETAMLGACYKATSATGESSVVGPYNLVNDYDAYLYSEYGFSSHTTPTGSFLVGAPYGGRWSDDNPGMYIEHIQTSNSRSRERILIHHSGAGGGSHSLLGYSITSGTAGNSREYVAVGVPRSNNLYGSVLINYLGLHNPALRIIGEGFGSYFGYAITTANVDGDDKGKDELLVGAPYFTSDFNSNSNMDSGCVFIYSIDVDSPSYQQVAKLCLGIDAGGARFGSAIAKLDDINNDRKDDFAVGAPYHDDRVGTIFIYFGGLPFSTKPAQVINGKSFNIPNLHGFGTFLLGGKVDVDGNNTPDLAISSFESNRVVVLRTRPVATASQRVTYHSADSTGSQGKIYKFLPTPALDYVRVRICVEFKFSVNLIQENQIECRLNFEMDKGTEFYDHLPAGAELRHNFSSTKLTCLDRHLRIKPGKLEVKVEAFPEGQEEKEKVKTNILIPLEAGVSVEVKAAERATGQTEIDPRISRVDLAQIFIIKNTGISSTALEKVKVDILVPMQLTVKNALTTVIGIANPAQYSSRMRCEADGFLFYNAAADLARNNTSAPQQLNKADSDKAPVFSSGDNVIKLSGCQAAKRPPSCSKITCVTDLPSMESRAIRLQMYLMPNAVKNLISDDTAGISIESQISVSFLNIVTKGSGEATRKFLMAKQIASWILILAAIGGSLLFLLLIFALFKCGFFRRKTKEQLRQAKRQTQLVVQIFDY
ncbi:Integrin alpha-8 [Orchesella cincta]|uniref:Integrin alpha-8 n=1 Tax=Orchesella cincta TaxID=48709 RepID=A0A1D2M3T8_ORCCI|nr:Integrin alpha-8 [Orchesella cincta]